MDPLLLLFLLVAVFLFLTIPIGFALGLASCIVVAVNDIPFLMFSQKYMTTFESFPVLAVPFFIIAGEIMSRGTMAGVLLNLSRSLVGHIRGGTAHVSILSCLFYGALCGAAPPTTAAVGGMMIPAMKKENYPVAFATAVNAAAGALGPIIPPSISIIIFGSTSGVSISDLFIAMIPVGILIAIGFMLLSYYYCARYGWGEQSRKASAAIRLKALWEARWALLVPLIVLGGIYGGITTPTEAGVVAVVYALLCEIFITRSLDWEKFKEIMKASIISTGTLFMIVAGANALGGILLYYNTHESIVNFISGMSMSPVVLLMFLVVLFLILGTFLDVVACILMLTPILMPVVTTAGIDPIQFGCLFVTTMVIGNITPPVGLNLYVGCSIGDCPFTALCKAIVPFVGVMTFVCMLLAWFPGLSTFLVQ